ncbi:MAG: aminotransferase class V-fold PLP-dependent enzyme [Gemmatimonadetes bacterium]|nr:aminotransferase class V-fold PLP-dependent enzyme [Gemmatimonadota bacterium]
MRGKPMDIEKIRDQMPGLRFGTYLNTGGIGQAPVCVNKAMVEGYQQMLSGSVGPADLYTKVEQAASEMPARIAEFFGSDAGEIALTMSTGEGYGMVLGGLSWQPGDEVIITNEEHPVPLQAAEGLADRVGAVIRVVEVDQDKDVFLKRLEDIITPRTRLFCFSHVTTDTGTRLPARKVCALARSRGVLTLWDGCQAVGQFPVDLHDMGCDFYATNCYKWMLSPMGTGFLYVQKDAQQVLKPLRRPHTPDGTARQYETGTPSSMLYQGLRASLDFMDGIGGPQAIAEEAGRKAESLRTRFDAIPGVRVITSRRAETQSGIVAFAIEGMEGTEVSEALRNRWQITQRATYINEPTGVRISVAFYTSDGELDTLVEAVTTLAGEVD